jgi:hypothetical protein
MVIGIDLETYSDIDLAKAGLYKYAENSEILLFAFAYGDEPVQVVDMACGEELPEQVLRDLTDPDVQKTAFNAAFEMHVLGHWLGQRLDPAQWYCTMVQSYTLGLPGHLKDVGKVLGLPEDKQKLAYGKRLIQYFCKPCRPTKANGGRTRNRPADAPDKWELFKTYNARDVETERAIRKKVFRFNPTPTERKLWCLDQKINDAGVLLDETLVDQAITLDARIKKETLEKAIALTGMENPNSNTQLLDWFERQEGWRPETLDKKARAELLMRDDLMPETKQMLRYKQLLSKTSVKKYVAMKTAECRDGRDHGMLQFCGAARTGRWCLTGDHEVLTPKGWVRIDQWQGGEIACWNTSGVISFSRAKKLEFPYDGPMITINTKRCEQISTPDHRMPYLAKDGHWDVTEIKNLLHKRPSIPFHGQRFVSFGNDEISLRILIMTQADGHYTKEALRFHFSKIRKIERCKHLLRRGGIPFIVAQNSDKTVTITIRQREMPMYLQVFRDKVFGTWILDAPADIVFDELLHWDGYKSSENTIQYVTTIKQNADLIQALAVMSDRSATPLKKHENIENWSTAYLVNIWNTPGKSSTIRTENFGKMDFKGTVYCAETKTGFFLVRRNGKVWVTGNSGRIVQLQNLPQNHLEDLDDAREFVKAGDLDSLEVFYDNPSDVLSQLIRTAFVAGKGKRFIVSDFAAIEARVIAWLADEEWEMKAFAEGKDIYCATASAMFGVPVVKHGINGDLRQKGKIATLACGYGGGVNALKAFGADKMGLSEQHMQDIVTKWRQSSPHIVRMWADVERAVKSAIRHKGDRIKYTHGLEFYTRAGLLFIKLPSGRAIAYAKPGIELETKFNNREAIIYEGTLMNGGWGRCFTWGGKLVENIVQATARDCLAVAMLRLDAAGYKIVMHVHDEVILEMPYGQGSLEEAAGIMGEPIPWAPGLLLRADGYETPYYKKD